MNRYYDQNRNLTNDELMHYGVLGMKWGVHRANKFAAKASNARAAGNKEAAAKYQAKSNKIKAKHTARVGGKASYNYSAKESVGKSLAKSYLMGTYGALKYNEARSKGRDRGEAVVQGLVYGIGNGLTGGVMSIVEPRLRGK